MPDRMFRPLMLLPLLLATSTVGAFADPILVTATRNVHGHALVDVDGLPVQVDRFEQVGTPLGPFNVDRSAHAGIGQDSATSAASQHTTIAGTRWVGSGSTAAMSAGDLGLDAGEAISVLGVSFAITDTTRYRLRGSIGAAGDSESELVFDGWTDAFGLSVDDELPNFRTAHVDRTGVLHPGAYTFFAFAQSTAGIADRTTPARATFGFDLAFGGATVPEPPSGLLLGSALLAFAYARRYGGQPSRGSRLAWLANRSSPKASEGWRAVRDEFRNWVTTQID